MHEEIKASRVFIKKIMDLKLMGLKIKKWKNFKIANDRDKPKKDQLGFYFC